MPELSYPLSEDFSPAMRMESFIGNALEAPRKFGDPLGLTAQDHHLAPFEELKTYVYTAIGVMAYRFRKSDPKLLEELKALSERTLSAKENAEIFKITDDGLELYSRF